MARIRTIKPEFWTSEQVVECSPTARLLFIGLWNFCDDGGVHPASVKRIKMEVFPADQMDDEEVKTLLRELIDAGLLLHYEAEDKEYYQVTGWKHQKIDKPNFRYPSSNGSRMVVDPSPTAHPRKGREGKGRDNTPPKPPKGGDDAFEVWWEVVHTKTGKEDARRAYRKAVDRLKGVHADPHAFLVERMKAFAATPSAKPTDRSPIHPATWLNKGRYDDDPAAWGRAGPSAKPAQRLPPLAEAIATWNPYSTPQ